MLHKRSVQQEYNGCDHTNTNAPDPIRTPQKRAWASAVLGWVTSWEVLVLHPFSVSFSFLKARILFISFAVGVGRNPTLARGDEGGRATLRNARLTRRYRTASYELATSLELARFMRNSAVAYTKFNICSARKQWVRSHQH